MNGFWHLVLSVGIGLVWIIALQGRWKLRGTTLSTAWNWAVLALVGWSTTWLAERLGSGLSPYVADHAWYACAVLALCPPIAVLGSRRPGTRVWTFFILFPMLFALGWPVIALWLQGTTLRGLQLETPQLVAFCLVLVMGIGNYCGTRFTLSALFYAAAVLAIVISSCDVCPEWLSERPLTRSWSTALMIISVISMKTSTRPVPPTRFDRLWLDFFDAFGIVWGRRIQDRVNYVATREGWYSRLDLEGFAISEHAPNASAQSPPTNSDASRSVGVKCLNAAETELRIEYVFRWLLRRFVDSRWIDERIGPSHENRSGSLTIDS